MIVDRLRTWIGSKIVKLGVRIVGLDDAKIEEAFPETPEDDHEYYDPTCPPVELSERAKQMVIEGMTQVAV
jgi:hypothetical protein